MNIHKTIQESISEFEQMPEFRFEKVSDDDLLKARFFNRCRVSDTGCWLWTGCRDIGGYGRITLNRKSRGAHVLSHQIFKGPIPVGLFVLHSCDTPACVNPAHLRAGTLKENTADCISRNRLNGRGQGARNGLSKLTDADIVDIRNSTLSRKELARKYKIDRTNVHCIVTGQTWTHVPMPEVRVEKADGRAKLLPAQVLEIRSADKSVSHGQLALKYGVGVPLISMIRNGRIWKHLNAVAAGVIHGN